MKQGEQHEAMGLGVRDLLTQGVAERLGIRLGMNHRQSAERNFLGNAIEDQGHGRQR